MSSVQDRLQIKRVPLDTWSIREQLCLASAVVRSGDQNWMSVSRSLKTIGEPNRPADWYSQKSCAAQYGVLLENVETPKRKKRCSEPVETPQESILKKLTQERIVELQKTLAEMNQQYDQLKSEVAEIRDPDTSEDRLREMWAAVEAGKRARERESAKRAACMKEREERRARAENTWRPPAQAATTTGAPPAVEPARAPPSSPLLTSLLKSSPIVTTPQHMPHPATVIETVSPSAGAPTLSMLLEQAGTRAVDNKHAAIEHIKSQLVQIEKRLKANRPVAPALEDIEIAAEDVVAMRHLHLATPIEHSTLEQVAPLSEAPEETAPVAMETSQDDVVAEESIKEEPMAMEVSADEITDIETITEEIPLEPEEPPPQPEAEVPVEPQPEVKISFPDSSIKFPTTDIKVIQSDEIKIKEEMKEPEPSIQTKHTQEEPNIQIIEENNIQQIEVEIPPLQPDVAAAETEVAAPLPVEVEVEEEVRVKVEEASEFDVEVETVETTIPPPEPEADPEPVPEPEAPPPPEAETNLPIEEPLPPEPTQQVPVVEAETAIVEEVKQNEEDTEETPPLKEIKTEDVEPKESELGEVRAECEEGHNETDDDAPMELSREEEKDGRKRRDYSRKKKSDSRTCSGSESAAEASAPESPGGERPPPADQRMWRKSVMLVYSRLCAHKYASIFSRPISDEEAPGYSAAVRRPMDLSTIRRNIDQGITRTTAQFQRDVLLMLVNALMYNSSAHSVHAMARDMFHEASCQLGMLVAAQSHAGLCQPPPTRKRRANT